MYVVDICIQEISSLLHSAVFKTTCFERRKIMYCILVFIFLYLFRKSLFSTHA